MKRILVTGGAGFIGSHLVDRLLSEGNEVIVLDNFHSFYAPELKRKNLSNAVTQGRFRLIEGDVREINKLESKIGDVDVLVHLAALAGVRPSIENPSAYIDVNVNGTLQVLEFCRNFGIKKMINASSSSVYGINSKTPWKESDPELLPISPYAASKIAAEEFCFVYSKLYGLNIISLRFFTVYGPRQRPDLAIHKFTKSIFEGKPIDFYGVGDTARDYTYVQDITDGIVKVLHKNISGYDVFNLGNSKTVSLNDLVSTIELLSKKQAIKNYKAEQPGDVKTTNADISKAMTELGYSPQTNLIEGLQCFIRWYESER